jgi:hypothetical protein
MILHVSFRFKSQDHDDPELLYTKILNSMSYPVTHIISIDAHSKMYDR